MILTRRFLWCVVDYNVFREYEKYFKFAIIVFKKKNSEIFAHQGVVNFHVYNVNG